MAGFSYAQQFCGATIGQGDCDSSCTTTNISYSFVNCACSGSIQSLNTCTKAFTQVCTSSIPVYDTCTRTKCSTKCTGGGGGGGGGPVPVMDIGKVNAGCTTTCREEEYRCQTGTQCIAYSTVENGCQASYRSVRCSGDPGPVDGGGGGPTCSAESACTPSCPAGTVSNNTGSGVSTPSSCSYRTGNVSGSSCETSTVTASCWSQIVPPIVTITNVDNTSDLGCVSGIGYMGKDANNKNRLKVDYTQGNSSDPFSALLVWFTQGSSTTPVITKIYDSGSPRLVNNGSYGILIRKVGSSWTDIYVPGVEGGQYTWIKSGTVGAGLRAEILGAGGNKMVGINDVSVSTAGSTISLLFDIQYYNSTSGISSYETANQGSTSIYASANATSSFLPSGGNTISVSPPWYNSGKSYILDLTDPASNSLSVTTVNGTTLDVAWSFADTHSGMKQIFGDASITGASNPDEIDDLTSGVNSYVFGSGSVGSELYNGTHLWQTALTTRTDRIDLNNNSRGQITFNTTGFDNACNYAVAQNSNFSLATPWVATKGGSVFGGAGIALDLPTLSGTGGFSNDIYWNSPFSFTKNEADYTSELASVSSATISSLLYPSTVGNYRMTNHNERSNKANYWFDELNDRSAAKVAQSPTSYNVVNFAGNATLATTSNAITSGGSSCTTNKTCVVNVSGNLTVNSGFVCDVRTIVFVEGTSTLEADITTNSEDKGCIFISRGNVTISDGTYKSGGSSYPVYDILEAFVITDGQIIIPAADASQSVKDGLLIHGSLLSFGSVSPSILMSRDLSLTHNQTFPTVAVHYDNRYLSIASFVFGGEGEYYRREVGFKPL